MSKIVIFGLVAAVILIAIGIFVLPDKTAFVDLPEPTPAASESAESQKTFSLSEIAEHATADDCWFAIEGKVYDVTKYIAGAKHPGGAAIVSGCGKDATEIFNNRPKDGEPHSDKARSFLPNFYIGDLAE